MARGIVRIETVPGSEHTPTDQLSSKVVVGGRRAYSHRSHTNLTNTYRESDVSSILCGYCATTTEEHSNECYNQRIGGSE